MSDIIHLLPDSIANQIAAGEVIQRPASVVKELIENAIDAGADNIQLIIKDAGRTLIQLIDNGKGMSATDARMAFERHATSKIRNADDLFALSTMGFRGEALPSIAAIAHIEIRTRQEGDDIGSSINIAGSKLESQESIACPVGTNISVKNIFFNVPARRKFLKTNETERRNILTELERIVLVHPNIEFTFVDNDIKALHYPICSLRQRIVNVIGKSMNQQLISIEIDTSLVKITGFVGKPESAKKTRAQQFFFVNNRYMRHAYFNRAILNAYESLIPYGEYPNYFIYLDVEPNTIDVNIHPTKTEIKFENEQAIWQILFAAIKEALGKFNAVPSIDFDTKDAIDIPIHDPNRMSEQPRINVDPSYNPFKSGGGGRTASYQRPKLDWEQFYQNFESEKIENLENPKIHIDADLFEQAEKIELKKESNLRELVIHYQYKNRYILTSVKSGLMLIDQHRAHVRILFDQFMKQIDSQKGISQRKLFPEIIELSPSEAAMIPYIMEDLEAVGFDLSDLGNNSYGINGTPADTANIDAVELIHTMLTNSVESGSDIKEEIRETMAISLANAAAIGYGKSLTEEEMINIVDQLLSSSSHKYTPDGKIIISLLDDKTIERMFK